MRRAHAVVAAAMLLVGGVAGPSAALGTQVVPGCAPGDNYVPGEECEVEVEPLSPDCIDTVPTLPYAVGITVPAGQPPVDTIDITWINPDGDDVVLVDQPLEGDLVWPGTVVGADGTATDWPDWTQNANGTWSRGDAFSWAVGSVDLRFGTNPSATVSVDYPDEPECRPEGAVLVSNPRPTGVSRVLAATGAAGPALAIGAGALLVGGTGLVLVRRRTGA
jgi:LPXTG-motif cell wall-anchored protein